MNGVLVVVHPFGKHKVGDLIADIGEMRDALRGENATHVVPTQISTPIGAKSKGS